MMEEREVNIAERVELGLETQSGKGMSKVLLAAFGIVTTGLLVSINTGISASNAIAQKAQFTADSARDTNFKQAQDIALLNVRTDSIERKTDATVAGLQALILQVTKNQDAIDQNKRDRKR